MRNLFKEYFLGVSACALFVWIALMIGVFSTSDAAILPREISKTTLIASVSKTATFYTDAYYLKSPHYAVYAKWTMPGASWLGTIRLQASLDGDLWENISSSDVAMLGSGSTYWNKNDASYLYGRVMGAVAAGSANILVKVNKK